MRGSHLVKTFLAMFAVAVVGQHYMSFGMNVVVVMLIMLFGMLRPPEHAGKEQRRQ